MRVVIISAMCYPLNTPRAFRTDELAKEFAREGHDVTVYSLLGDYDYGEYSLKTGIRMKSLGKSLCGVQDSMGKSNWNIISKVINHTIGKYIDYPYCELVGMVKRAVEKEGKIDLLITIAFPHSVHLGASKASLKNVKVWIADCGDPFMGNPFEKRPSYMSRWEKRWSEKCNYITIPVAEGIDAYYPEYHDKIRIIPQGFDMEGLSLNNYKRNNVPTFCYAGYIYPRRRDPIKMIKYLLQLDVDFRFVIYTAPECYKSLISRSELLDKRIEIKQFIPREQLLSVLPKMDFLVNIMNNSGVQQPSKLIDYAIAKRPIINISSDFSEEEKRVLSKFLNADYSDAYIVKGIEQYDIRNVAKQFLDLVEE